MLKRLITIAAASVAAVTLSASAAGAHPVGTPGEPNCHGQRISHGNDPKDPAHGLTPPERAAILTEIIAEGGPFGSFLELLFGEEVSVAEFHQFVRACAPPPQ